ncbi:MAG: GAF domain-containing protein, partial [Spirochaetaceae bacterium]|nr:GAF domain-containing protein [Spirochaetaceae bacterium]
LNLDSVAIWRIDTNDKDEVYSTCLYSWAVAGMPDNNHIREKSDITKEEADRWYDTMKKNRSFMTSISKVTNEKDKQALQRYDFFSIYMLPIHIDGSLWGYFELGDATQELNFSDQQVGLLKMNAQLISLSIQERLKK